MDLTLLSVVHIFNILIEMFLAIFNSIVHIYDLHT